MARSCWILRLREDNRGIAPGIKREQWLRQGEAWQEPGLCMEKHYCQLMAWWGRDGENESCSFSHPDLSHSPIAWAHGRVRGQESPVRLVREDQAPEGQIEIPPDFLLSVFFRPYLNADLPICIHPPPPTHTPSTDYTCFTVLCHMPCQGTADVCTKHHSHHVNSILWNHATHASFCGPAFALHAELCWLGCGPRKENRQRRSLIMP